jgi:hypothetical protein|tara:strand:+ start:668 stop:805 length:138 start_codon:yes stop_codon:yes gene_type:complete
MDDTSIELLRSVLITALFVAMVGVALLELRKVVTRKWREVREEGK